MATLTTVALEILFIACGLMCFYVGGKTLAQKDHPSRIGTAIFWMLAGLVIGFGKFIQSASEQYGNMAVGILVIAMVLPSMLKKVKSGAGATYDSAHAAKMSDKIGYKIFLPTLSIGGVSLLFALFFGKTAMGANAAIVGLLVGVVIAGLWVLAMSKDKAIELMDGGKQLLDTVGPLCMLPQMLAALGAVFTAANVGSIVAKGAGMIIPQGNVTVGIIVYAVGMVLFTMLMGNAFAAFSVMTIGIGIPFVIQYGLDPTTIGMLALTSGYCGTLMTPMAANFNILPVAILDMKDKYRVIKRQIPIALTLLVIQIIMMIAMG